MTEPDRAPGGGRAPAGPPGRLTEPGRSSPGGPGPRPTDGQANGRLRLVTVVAAAVARSDPNPDHGKWSESRWPPAGAAALRAGAISKSVPSLRLRVVAAPWQQLSPVYVTRTGPGGPGILRLAACSRLRAAGNASAVAMALISAQATFSRQGRVSSPSALLAAVRAGWNSSRRLSAE